MKCKILKSSSSQNLTENKVVRPKPGWDETTTDHSKFKLNEKETLLKKINIMSKNALIAKQELRNRKFNIETDSSFNHNHKNTESNKNTMSDEQ